MADRQVDGIDTYGFPDDLIGNPLFAWMGDDYVRFVAGELRRRFREQDPSSEMVAVKCETFPIVEVSTRDDAKTVRGVMLVFSLQILMRAADARHWRLRGAAMCRADALDEPARRTVSVSFELDSAEEVS